MKSTRSAARDRRQKRVRRKIAGTAQRPRLTVYRSNKYIYAQVIDDVEGRTLAAASSHEPDLRGSSLNVDVATRVGELVGQRAREAGVSEIVFDRAGYKFHGRVKALADAARDAGLEF